MDITELDKGTSRDQPATNAKRSIVSRDGPNVATAVEIIWRHCHIKQKLYQHISAKVPHRITSLFYIVHKTI